MHLKPCFLYLGIFPEDKDIKTSVLIRLWVAEGILRPIDDKSLEEVAEEYLKELIDRNLVLVSKLRWNGEAKVCKIHDLLRDVCLREAQKKKFFYVPRQQNDYTPTNQNMERRICVNFHENLTGWMYSRVYLHTVESASLTRSLLYRMPAYWRQDSPSVHLGLLRVYSSVDEYNFFFTDSNNAIFKHANLRYLSLKLGSEAVRSFRSLCCLLWNLQTLKVGHPNPFLYRPIMMAPSEIWDMPLLKHVMLYDFVLPDRPNGEHSFVLKYLHTLSGIRNLKFSEEVIKRIPNVKKLKVQYKRCGYNDKEWLFINNIGRLQKLESLSLNVDDSYEVEEIRRNLVSFPHSLKKLTLEGTELSWEELTIRIGSLPLLQYLKLDFNACRGAKWETVEGQFCSLRVLRIHMCADLECWETDSVHFPRLEHLYLSFILFEIPSSIGDIPTLKSIRLEDCIESVEHSVKRIKVEQDENGNEDLQIIIGGKVVQVDSDVQDQEEDEVDLNGDDQVELDDMDEDDQEDDQFDLDEENEVDDHVDLDIEEDQEDDH